MLGLKTFFFVSIFAVLFFNNNYYLHAQYETQSDKIAVFNNAPLSPQTRYFSTLQFPVNLYVGRPDISIPIHEISCGNLNIPISIDYSSGGVRVAQVASSVGLGWNLNAGGAITRVVKGMPDELTYSTSGGYKSGFFALKNPTVASIAGENQFRQYAQGYLDSEPDEFYYNFPGKSGKFIFDSEVNIYLIPFTKIRIKPNYIKLAGEPEGGLGTFESWIITDEFGNEFYFKSAETNVTRTRHIEYGDWGVLSKDYEIQTNPDNFITSWHLDRIRTPSGNEVTYEYERKSLYFLSNQMLRYSMEACLVVRLYKDNFFSTISTPKLSKIRFDNSELRFKDGNARCDIKGDNTLSSIELWNKMPNGEVKEIKKFSFTYGYSQSRGIGADESCPSESSYWNNIKEDHVSNRRRLMLKNIEESGLGVAKPPYEFTYFDDYDTISRFAKSVDYSGYYTGSKPNASFHYENQTADNIMKLPMKGEGALLGIHMYWPQRETCDMVYGVDKWPVLANSKFLSLQRIKQPSGLVQDFVYELNEAYSKDHKRSIPVDGLRIRSIKSTIPPTGIIHTKNYSYVDASGGSTGRFTGDTERTFNGYSPHGEPTLFAIGLVEFPLTQGNAVGYSEVTETENGTDGKQGKTTFKFYSPADFPDIINRYYPFGPPKSNNEWKRGIIKEKITYKYSPVSTVCPDGTSSNFCPVDATRYDYTFYDEANPNINTKSFDSFKVGYPTFSGPGSGKFWASPCGPAKVVNCQPVNTFRFFSGYYQLKKKTEIIY